MNSTLTKFTFAPLLEETFLKSDLRAAIKNGFRTCGMYPFNADAVDYTKCVQNIRENLSNARNSDSITCDIEMVELTIHNIAPQVLTRGIDSKIIVEELRKAYNLPQEDMQTVEVNAAEEDVGVHQEENSEVRQQTSDGSMLNVCSENGIDATVESNIDCDLINKSEFISLDDDFSNIEILFENDLLYGDQCEIIHSDGTTEMVPVIDISTFSENNTTIQNATSTLNHNKYQAMDIDQPSCSTFTTMPHLADQPDQPSCSSTTAMTPPLADEPSCSSTITMTPPREDQTFEKSHDRSPVVIRPVDNSKSAIRKKKIKILSDEPFNGHLFFPTPILSNNSRPLKEKPPSAISSRAWRDFYNKKEEEKKSLAKAKEQRKETTLKRKEEKAALEKEKEKQKKRKKECAIQNIKEEKAPIDNEKEEQKEINQRCKIKKINKELPTAVRRTQRVVKSAVKNNDFIYYTEDQD